MAAVLERFKGVPIVIPADPKARMTQDPRRSGEVYAEYKLTDEEKKHVIYRKLESTNPDLSDTLHDPTKPWVEEWVGTPDFLARMSDMTPRVVKEDGYGDGHPLGPEDGVIMIYHGHPLRTVYMERNGDLKSKDEADEQRELTGRDLPEYVLWGFCVHKIIITDGPQQRAYLHATNEQKRARAEEQMFQSFEKIFGQIANKMGGGDPKNVADLKVQSPGDVAKLLAQWKVEDPDAVEKALATVGFAPEKPGRK